MALSSGEAEYNALVKGISVALGTQALLRDLGVEAAVRVHADSSAAKGIAARTGLGKTRHIAVHLLWIQEKVRGKAIELLKCKGTENPADLLTKHLDQTSRCKYYERWGLESRAGRSEIAPHVV